MFIHPSVYRLLDTPMYVERSAYSLDEIKATIATAERVKAEYEALCNQAYTILDPIAWYDRMDKENNLNDLLSKNATIQPGFHHSEIFPLTQWHKAIAAQRTHNRRIQKALKEFETCQPNP